MARIGNADSPDEALAVFLAKAPLLNKCKFILAARGGAVPGFAVNRTFSAGASIRSLFNTAKILVLDADTVREMVKGEATYPIDYSISLDTQALSYLEPYMAGRSARIPEDFKEVFNFIARDDVYVDPIPYMYENLHNLGDKGAADQIFAKVKAYEVLRTIDSDWLQARGEIRSTLSEQDLVKRAQEQVARMFMERDDGLFMKYLNFCHQFMYGQLLKMASIQLRAPGAHLAKKKIELFIEFSDNDLATISTRETVLARAYFERGQELAFFGKVQKKKADVFAVLGNMAWDLWHVRQLEIAMTLKPSSHARYFFPALLTFDKGLIEVIDLYPLKACGFMEGDHEPMPFYAGDWFQLVADGPTAKTALVDRFFSDEARASRDARRDTVRGRLGSIVDALEDELSEVASVQKPRD